MLNNIRPYEHRRVIDLLVEADVDVSDWSNYKGTEPASNPKYCYAWSFAAPGQPIVLNLWFNDMKHDSDGNIYQQINLRKYTIEMERDRVKSPRVARARQLDDTLKLASREKTPVRVIICDGHIKDKDESSSTVRLRRLDELSWWVSYHMETGECRISRGSPATVYVDQFTLAPEKSKSLPKEINGLVFERSSLVRSQVLNNAEGKCEFCGAYGFETPSGRYLETHHVISLSDGGSDTVSNVIALCPTDHREAHYGIKCDQMRQAFFSIITKRKNRKP